MKYTLYVARLWGYPIKYNTVHESKLRWQLSVLILYADLDLKAFPSLYEEESYESRLNRLQAFKRTWQAVEEDIKVCHQI